MSKEQEKKLFWQQFLASARQVTDLYADSAIQKNKHYIHVNTGLGGLYYSTPCTLHESWVEVCIQCGSASVDIFNDIRKNQQIIEGKFGEPLRWINEESKKRCKIMTRSVSRGRDDADVEGLSRILAERMVRFYNAIHPFLPVQKREGMPVKEKAGITKSVVRRKKSCVGNGQHEQSRPVNQSTERRFAMSDIEALFRKSMQCRSCFSSGVALQADIDIAQPRPIGKNYFSTMPRIVVVTLNPGAGNSNKKQELNRVFKRWLYQYRDKKKTVEELFAFQEQYMQQWGVPHGRYLRFYCDGMGLSLGDIAMVNIAWCADVNNAYPTKMLNDCFNRHTGPLVGLLQPEIMILSGTTTHRFASRIKNLLPKCHIIQTLHYAHRLGYAVEQAQLCAVREQIAYFTRAGSDEQSVKIKTPSRPRRRCKENE